MRKLFLSEDLEEDILMDDGEVVGDDYLMINGLITAAIKSEWELIEFYNGAIASVNDENAVSVLTDIVNEEYVHIGQLEALLQGTDQNSASIEDGRDQIDVDDEDELMDISFPEEDIVIEGLQEGFTPWSLGELKSHNAPGHEVIAVGLYDSPKSVPERYHYEIDPELLVYTKVKPDRFLSKGAITSVPFDEMDQVEEYAKSVLESYEGFKEVDNDKFIKMQKDKWKKLADENKKAKSGMSKGDYSWVK